MKTNNLEDLAVIKHLLPLENKIDDSFFNILSFHFCFFRRSTNTFTDIRLVVVFEYKGNKCKYPFSFYPRSGESREEAAKRLCARYNAPRCPNSIKLTEAEFYNKAKEMGNPLTKKLVIESINHDIKNGHYEPRDN